ncbi:MAG: class I SAM-dependent methyltransferase [Phenylobacterium sp.]|uniref:class I SAM-dependent methyltransferase n=1 Tax=Phenylobacterium sp. TaxID=1871053 RepID=UPI0027349B2B|nr:class I SAM-dependent methyltransferase [Phenylobacterium sp.]MDP3174217.1 class I SAM-dependent methyltransferase [Phenylobacterium sp.]
MDPSTLGYISYRWHRISNPFSMEQLERTLAYTDLAAGDRAADLGCGNAIVSVWMAERFGLHLSAVERFAPVAEVARETAAKPRSQGVVEIVEGAAQDYLAAAGQHRLVSMIGAIDVLPGVRRPVDVMLALIPSIAPGGWLLWGDPFWRRPPSAKLATVFSEERFDTLAGWVAAGEAAGLVPHHVAVSPDAEWEEFVWRMNASLEAWAEEHTPSADADAIRLRASMLRTLYLEEGRESMGFAFYLFRRPIA